jgi:hypothetical protein
MIEANPKGPKHVGTYNITVTVSDSALSVSTSFVVTVPNSPPRFNKTLSDKTLPINSLGSYDLSDSFLDDDGNPLTMIATSSFENKPAQSLPVGNLLTIKNMFTIAIAPTQMSELGTYLITVTVSDTLATA